MELDISKPRENHIWIGTSNEEGYWQKIEYENLPLYCSKCLLKGHNIVSCKYAKTNIHPRKEHEVKTARRTVNDRNTDKLPGFYYQGVFRHIPDKSNQHIEIKDVNAKINSESEENRRPKVNCLEVHVSNEPTTESPSSNKANELDTSVSAEVSPIQCEPAQGVLETRVADEMRPKQA